LNPAFAYELYTRLLTLLIDLKPQIPQLLQSLLGSLWDKLYRARLASHDNSVKNLHDIAATRSINLLVLLRHANISDSLASYELMSLVLADVVCYLLVLVEQLVF